MHIQKGNVAKMTLKLKRNCLYCIFLLTFLLLLHPVKAQYDFSGTDNWLSENITDLGGRAVLLILKEGRIIYSKSVNNMNMRQKVITKIVAKKIAGDSSIDKQDYNADFRIAIASCSKWLSAALVMTFIDEGSLKLNDTVGQFLPIMSVNGKGNITIADCLSHLTGIKSGSVREARKIATEVPDMEASMKAIAALPMEAKPGTAFHYNSLGLQIAAAVIENISGKPFKTLFHERIAMPCSMMNTDFGNKPVPLPAGGAVSTAFDYLNFLQMILNKGIFNGRQVLSSSAIELMQRDQLINKKIIHSPANADTYGYGFGEWIMQNELNESTGSVTSPGLFGSFPWIDNKRRYAAVLFTFNFKSKGRHQLYNSLKASVDATLSN